MKCLKCGKEIKLGDDYYNDWGDSYCTDCINEQYSEDEIIMLYAGFDIEREKDRKEYENICAKYPNRNIRESADKEAFDKFINERNEEYDSHFYFTTFEDEDCNIEF